MKNILVLISFLLLFTNCNVTKHLQEGELLITETKIQYENPERTKNENKFKSELYTAIDPVPNTGVFKFRLSVYQWANKKKKEKGIRKKIQNLVGEAPALYNDKQQQRNRSRMKKMLKDNGFFDSDITIDTTVSGKKVAITYEIATDGQFSINKIIFPSDTTEVGRLILKNQQASLLKPRSPYSEPTMSLERSRIATLAGNNGYLDFNENYIYYLVDTLPGSFLANIYMRVKLPDNQVDHQQFTLGTTVVYPNYDLANKKITGQLDTARHKKHFYIFENDHLVDHKILDKMILQEEGDRVSKKFQDASVNHLLDLGIFKFVNLKYERVSDSTEQYINRTFYLTPSLDQNFSTDLELNNRTGRFYGIGASASYTHRNIFKKALTFNTSLAGGLETQVGNDLGFINTLEVNLEASLSTPRFIMPFKTKEYEKYSSPKTTLSAGNDYQQRISQYTLNSTNLKMGYQWKENSREQHTLYPISINMVNVLNKSSEFDSLLLVTPRLQNSFRNFFIAGLDYTYVFSNQSPNPTKDFWFFRSNFRTSGNLLQLVSNALSIDKGTDDQVEIFGVPFAQFLSLETDVRYYERMNNTTIAFRLAPSIGVAYGNSNVLPYIEQFFVGGANSIRAFPLRSVGPGSFVRSDTVQTTALGAQFIDQTGDIKIEMNTEFRFPIFGYFKGALFVDAGNVWLLNDDSIPGGKFDPADFWKEIAVGSGLGLRVDADIIVVRFDIGIPLRRATLNDGFQWTFDSFDLGSSKWRGDNLIGNLAIGYPF